MTIDEPDILVAVITGAHAFDVPNFQRLFRRLPGIDAYIQTMDDFGVASQETRDAYDAVVFYHMLKETPADGSKLKNSLEHLAETGQGLVVMHHALLAYPQWPAWRALSGIDPTWTRYDHAQNLRVRVVDPAHPVTAGYHDFELVDETYQMGEPDPGSHILLTTEHPYSLKALAWTHSFGLARVFSQVMGHDNDAWVNPGFETILHRGILWACCKLG